MGVSDYETRRLVEEVYDLIKDIRDPEKPHTLEELGVVSEEEIRVERDSYTYLSVTLMPTVPHCHLAAIIGLCVRQKLERELPYSFKLDIFIKEGTHTTAAECKNAFYTCINVCHSPFPVEENYPISLSSKKIWMNW